VVINGSNSNWLPEGFPQGSILGTFLFIIFLNDIVNEINAEIKLFADDSKCFTDIAENDPNFFTTI
jgi:hypothetical protein